MFANTEPEETVPEELVIDNSENFESVVPEMKALAALAKVAQKGGTPPPLHVMWGTQQKVVAIEDVKFQEGPFNHAGDPYRVRVNIQWIEHQQTEVVKIIFRDDVNFDDLEPGVTRRVFGPQP